jgi:hypothetical protein
MASMLLLCSSAIFKHSRMVVRAPDSLSAGSGSIVSPRVSLGVFQQRF